MRASWLRRALRSPGAGSRGGRRLLAVHALDRLQDGGGGGTPPLAGRNGIFVRLRLGHPQPRRGYLGRRLLQHGAACQHMQCQTEGQRSYI